MLQRTTAAVFLPAFTAYALSRFSQKLSRGNERLARVLRDAPSILDVISEINLAVFYFSGVYYNLVKRLLRIRNVRQSINSISSPGLSPRLKISSIPENPNARPPSYSFLGILIGIRLLYRLTTAIRAFRTSSDKATEAMNASLEKDARATSAIAPTEATIDGLTISAVLAKVPGEDSEPVPAEDDEFTVLDFARVPLELRARRSCTLCLEERTGSCATECGHLFCWACIISWGREKVSLGVCVASHPPVLTLF